MSNVDPHAAAGPSTRALQTGTSRELLLHLLAEAAEFEHGLLCCYLYAAFSLKGADDASLTPRQVRAVAAWHDSVMAVAIEEMVHLLLVANLTVALGGRPHFDRPNLPVAAGYHPAGMVIELAPFDMDTLDHFIFLERPEGVAMPDGETFEPQSDYERTSSRACSLMPNACDYSTIAEFYRSIRRHLQALTTASGEPAVFIGDEAAQIGADGLHMKGLRTIRNLATALDAIDTIVIQGEGAATESEESHFARFVAIKREYAALLDGDAAFVPARPAARNPVMRAPTDPAADRVHITEPDAAAAVDFANALYNEMLRLLSQSMGRVDRDAAAKRQLIEAAIALMKAFAAVATELTRLPANAQRPGINAGVSFATLRATEPLLENAHEWAVIIERLGELAAGGRTVTARAAGLRGAVASLEQLQSAFASHSKDRSILA